MAAGVATAPTVCAAAFIVDHRGSRTAELDRGARVRGASVLKPLLCWAASRLEPFAGDRAAWAALTEPAITTSDNEALAALWDEVGEAPLLGWLNERLTLGWHVGGAGEHPALRVMVTAGELAQAYAALAADRAAEAAQVRRWMRAVVPEQSFGLRKVAAGALGVERALVGVKCGWFGAERAHAVVMIEDEARAIGAAITCVRSPDAASRAAAQEAAADQRRLVNLHDALFGRAIRSPARRALVVASTL